MSKQSKIIIVIFVFIILNICFIFSQSCMRPAESNMLSGRFELVFEGIIAKLFNVSVDADFFTRKLAHLIEFFVLGVLTFTNVNIIFKTYHKSFYGYGLFFVLSVAVTDEFIQIFSGRTSSVKDILIDFFGAVIGLITVAVFTHFRKNKSLEK